MDKEKKADYSTMTDEEFDQILRDRVHDLGTDWLLGLKGVWTTAAEELNNDVLDEWAEQHPDRAYRR